MAFSVLAIVWLLVIALAAWWVSTKVPFVSTIVGVVTALYLFGVFLTLQDVTIVSDLVDKIPFLTWVLGANAGIWIGEGVAGMFRK